MPSAHSTTCPDCRTDEYVTGRTDEQAADVELTCGRCGRSWWRGQRGCASCGGHDLTDRPQVMRRHSRGTQLSILGWRDAILCRACDAEVLAALGSGHTPIPEDYVSAALIDVNVPAEPRSPRDRPPRNQPPRDQPRHERPRQERPRSDRTDEEPPAPPPSNPIPAPSEPTPPPAPTTVRQALERSQTMLTAEGTTLDATVILLLGQHLGPTTRLDDASRDPAAVRDWAEGLWGDVAAARETITALADHWRQQGWTTTDMAASLRPQENS